ncbi:MAG: hypothetical protein CL949_09455 [Erythrobacter sp.]|nr:hypothetical protein [Erythrobacter sp.]
MQNLIATLKRMPASDHPFAPANDQAAPAKKRKSSRSAPAKRSGAPAKSAKASAKAKRRRMAFLPDKVQTKIGRNDKPYIKARGEITYRRRSFTYTLMVPFWRYHRFAEALEAGHPIELEGYRRQVTTDKNGKSISGGIYFEAATLLGVMDGTHHQRGSSEPSRSLAGHERRGYYRRQHYGPGNSKTKIIWIDSVEVNGGQRLAA